MAPLLNYSTKIDAWQTVSEIQQVLAKSGATHLSIKTDAGQPAAITFTIDLNNQPLNFALPCNVKGIHSHFENLKGPERETLVKNGFYAKLKKDPGLASSIGWRILKNWIESQCALIQIEMVSNLAEVFLSSLIVNEKGETLGDKLLKDDGLKLLKF